MKLRFRDINACEGDVFKQRRDTWPIRPGDPGEAAHWAEPSPAGDDFFLGRSHVAADHTKRKSNMSIKCALVSHDFTVLYLFLLDPET